VREPYVNRRRAPALLCVAILLSACGGGGGGGGGGNGGGGDPRFPGSLQFAASSVSVDENSGTATLTITRTGGIAGAVSVELVSSDGSATAGQDYTSLSTSVSFAAGDASAKTVTVSIADDTDTEADETLSFALAMPTGGASVGANGAATLTILDDDPPAAPVLEIGVSTKQLGFEWASVPGATHYRLLRDPDGASGFTQLGADHPAGVVFVTIDIAVHRLDWVNARYRLEACNADRCAASAAVSAVDWMVQAIGYVKASNTQAEDEFGFAIALSTDGRTLAVGAHREDSGVIDDQSDNSQSAAGAAYVFTRNGSQWTQQAYLKASNPQSADLFGRSIALSGDGNTLAVGATGEDGGATGVNGDQNEGADGAGAVYVYTRNGTQWSQQAYVKASNTGERDTFGRSVGLSADGNTLVVGAQDEDSDATGVNGDANSNLATNSGAVYVYTRVGTQWSQPAYLKASNTDANDAFGRSLVLSGDGRTLAVGAEFESGVATGVNGDDDDDSAPSAGAVYVFAYDGVHWSQQAYVKASNTRTDDRFGIAIALSADGHILAVGAHQEDSDATGVDGDDDNDNATDSGAVYVFVRDGMQQWSQQTYVKASNTQAIDNFGGAVALSADGHTLAVGSQVESSNAIGVGGDQNNDDLSFAGAVYTFTRDGTSWRQQAYVKASNTGTFDLYGNSVALSADGDTLAVAAWLEKSDATGVGGDQTNDNASDSGAVYIY
jgi:hypothetical protein